MEASKENNHGENLQTAKGKESPKSKIRCLRDQPLRVERLHLFGVHDESETWGPWRPSTSNAAAHFLVANIRTGEFIIIIPSKAGHPTPHIYMSQTISNSSPSSDAPVPCHATVPRSTAGQILILVPDGRGVWRRVVMVCL